MIFLKKLLLLPVFSVCIAAAICVIIAAPESAEAVNTVSRYDVSPIIIIDPGHGGFDGGTSTTDGIPEKDINLAISLYLRDYLEYFGFKTVMTRETDTSLEANPKASVKDKKTSDIHYRFDLMETTDNCIFVSVHQNHFSESKYSGAQVFYSPKASEYSQILAQCIQSSVVSKLQPTNTRMIKPCDTSVYLIYNATKPAVLVECGFLSNEEEAENLKSSDYQKKTAFSIAAGIAEYCSRIKEGEENG